MFQLITITSLLIGGTVSIQEVPRIFQETLIVGGHCGNATFYETGSQTARGGESSP